MKNKDSNIVNIEKKKKLDNIGREFNLITLLNEYDNKVGKTLKLTSEQRIVLYNNINYRSGYGYYYTGEIAAQTVEVKYLGETLEEAYKNLICFVNEVCAMNCELDNYIRKNKDFDMGVVSLLTRNYEFYAYYSLHILEKYYEGNVPSDFYVYYENYLNEHLPLENANWKYDEKQFSFIKETSKTRTRI